jgi:hypothetical protein
MVPRSRAVARAKRLSGGFGAGHRGLSAGSQRHFRRSNGQDVEKLPTGIVFGAHFVAAKHGRVVCKDGRGKSRGGRQGRTAGVRGRPGGADLSELTRKTRGSLEQNMGSVSVVGLGPQTGVRPREDDRHLGSGQIRLGQVRTEQEDARQEEPKAPNGKRKHPDRGGGEVPWS